jgi:signal transduction histidine kinase
MKIIFAALLTIVTSLSLAQRAFVSPKPVDTHVTLDKEWVYLNDDKPAYRLKDFNDLTWKKINPGSPVDDIEFNPLKQGVSWMRLHFQLADQPNNGIIALMFHQSVASEIYLNGRLLKSYGHLGASPGKTIAFDPRWTPIIVQLDSTPDQVLAVRFGFEQGIRSAAYFGAANPMFEVRMMEPERASVKFAETYQRTWIDFLILGVFLAISMLHLAFFLMYREQKANLYFSMSAFLGLLGTVSHVYFYHMAQPDNKFLFASIALFLYLASSLMILVSTYAFLQRRKGPWFFSWLAIGIISFSATFFWPAAGFNASIITANILTYVVILIIAQKATKTNSMGAYAIITGSLTSLIAFVLFIFAASSIRDEILWADPVNTATFITLIRSLALPAALSIFLAREFAVTSRNLAVKLKQVEELSADKLRDEKEKQEMLTSRNTWLEQRVTERTRELEQSLQDLRSTQAQLVQSEKMASLGELTAGIAHEIQNPLNFVNNFSEINAELSEEILEAATKGNIEEVKALASDIKSNQDKIREHGKRADSIVKGMLQHSRSSSGTKEPTDISALADEYLGLAYHGMRAKDKSFNASIKTDFDQAIGTISLVPHEIGRVLLNLFNNAFYAVNEQSKKGENGYEPAVIVKTTSQHDQVYIAVSDNGTGIPEKVKEKIFQPFFTTKPTGQGTGLGLSLSYDTIKSMGGEISVESKEGAGSTFTIRLPITRS